jgi:hypothetical protein
MARADERLTPMTPAFFSHPDIDCNGRRTTVTTTGCSST